MACIVYDGTRTRIVKIDARTGNVEGIGWFDGHFVSDQNVVRGWLTGWAGSRPVAIRLSTGEVLHMPERAGAATLLPVATDRLAAVMMGDSHFTVRVYPLRAELGGSHVREFEPARFVATPTRRPESRQ